MIKTNFDWMKSVYKTMGRDIKKEEIVDKKESREIEKLKDDVAYYRSSFNKLKNEKSKDQR